MGSWKLQQRYIMVRYQFLSILLFIHKRSKATFTVRTLTGAPPEVGLPRVVEFESHCSKTFERMIDLPLTSTLSSCCGEHGQDGSNGEDLSFGSAWVDNNTFAACGSTNGHWNSQNLGSLDFMAVGLDPSDGSERWRWQVKNTISCASLTRSRTSFSATSSF